MIMEDFRFESPDIWKESIVFRKKSNEIKIIIIEQENNKLQKITPMKTLLYPELCALSSERVIQINR